jgi:hypothetical protein
MQHGDSIDNGDTRAYDVHDAVAAFGYTIHANDLDLVTLRKG